MKRHNGIASLAALFFCLSSVRSFVHVFPSKSSALSQRRLQTTRIPAVKDTPNGNEDSLNGNSSSSSKRRQLLSLATSAVLASSTVAAAVANALDSVNTIEAVATASTALDPIEKRRIQVFEQTVPSVVFIDTFVEQRDSFSTMVEVPLGSGSGIVWDKEGHIVTNYHVVRNAQAAQVAILAKDIGGNNPQLMGGSGSLSLTSSKDDASASSTASPLAATTTTATGNRPVLPYTSMRPTSEKSLGFTRSVYSARVVGVDPSKDIAVLKVDNVPPSLLTPISVGTSNGLRVGQTALAIGNPFGLDHTLTMGIISGIGRQMTSPTGRPISNVIQTDAAVNPGNSGGPLLDTSGRMIGMNTSIYSPSGASAGIGFAIPMDTIQYIATALIRDGKIVRPILGISYLESRQARTMFGVTSGVLVLNVPLNSPPAKAGLRGTQRNSETGLMELGDILVKVGPQSIQTEQDLFAVLETYQPGDVVDVTVRRLSVVNGELKAVEVVLKVPLQSSDDIKSISSSLSERVTPY